MTIVEELQECPNLESAKKLINLGNNHRPSGKARRLWLKITRERFGYLETKKEKRERSRNTSNPN